MLFESDLCYGLFSPELDGGERGGGWFGWCTVTPSVWEEGVEDQVEYELQQECEYKRCMCTKLGKC